MNQALFSCAIMKKAKAYFLEFYYLWWLEDGQSCYLETHNFRNVAYYEKYGFKTMEIGLLPGTNTEHFAMLREAK